MPVSKYSITGTYKAQNKCTAISMLNISISLMKQFYMVKKFDFNPDMD